MLTSKCPYVLNATDPTGGELNVSMNPSHQSRLCGQPKVPMHDIHWSYGWTRIYAGSDKSSAHGRTWVFQKAYR